MADEPDYILDLSSSLESQPTDGSGVTSGPGRRDSGSGGSRKWIGVHFNCCDVYSRIWRNRQGTAYVGYCPRCSRRIQALIGPGGVDTRFFEAG
jgi:hypothetical protein